MKKWILRLLTTFAVMGALILFALKIVSGTSDSHRDGLEQAFSQIFRGDASIGTLKTFNLIPQFTIEIEKLAITGIQVGGAIKADQLLISFGPLDLMTNNRLIEAFHLKNLEISKDLYTPLEIKLDDAGIYPNEKGDAASFNLKGSYGDKPIEGSFAMLVKSGIRPKYTFDKQNEFTLNFGAVQITGLFSPYDQNTANISRIKLVAQKHDGKIECALPDDQVVALKNFMQDIMARVALIKSPAELNKLCTDLKDPAVK